MSREEYLVKRVSNVFDLNNAKTSTNVKRGTKAEPSKPKEDLGFQKLLDNCIENLRNS